MNTISNGLMMTNESTEDKPGTTVSGQIEHVVSGPPRMMKAHQKQVETAKAVEQLIYAVAKGGWLEFKHNDGNWRLSNGTNVTEVAMSPHRFRVAH